MTFIRLQGEWDVGFHTFQENHSQPKGRLEGGRRQLKDEMETSLEDRQVCEILYFLKKLAHWINCYLKVSKILLNTLLITICPNS